MKRRRFLQALLGTGSLIVPIEEIEANTARLFSEEEVAKEPTHWARRAYGGERISDFPQQYNDHADRLDALKQEIERLRMAVKGA